MKKTLLILGLSLISFGCLYGQCVNCYNPTNTGTNSSAIGTNTVSTGHSSFASGFGAVAEGNYSVALGINAEATYTQAIAFGSSVRASGDRSIVIGCGNYGEYFLDNNKHRSLMVGFTSKYPTLFVGESPLSLYNDKTGRIGIGNVTDPQAKLHLRADEGEAALMLIEPFRWETGQEGIIALGSMQNNIRGKNNSGLIFNSESNFLFKNGSVGIGELTQPQAKLHIKGSKFETPNIFIEPFRQEIGKGASQAGLYLGDFEHGISYNSAVGLMYLTANNHVFQGGNVGIGVLEPAALLHVEDKLGSFKYSDTKAIISGNEDLVSLLFHNSSGDYIISKMADRLEFRNDDTFQMGLSDTYGLIANKHITVGWYGSKADIWPGAGVNVVQDGTLNQKSAEFITEEGGRIFFVPRLGTGSYCPSTVKGDAGIFWSNTKNQNDDGGFVIGPHDTEDWTYGLRIDQHGNVGIGTAEPGERLEVNGKVIIRDETWISGKVTAEEIEVKADVWSDFVFDENYSLCTLSEVETFINENKHLPDVPSQDEVLENGINLGEMDALLLQKIEELTLYVIELEKKVEKLENEKE